MLPDVAPMRNSELAQNYPASLTKPKHLFKMLQSNAAVLRKREKILIGNFYYENIELTFLILKIRKFRLRYSG